MKKLMMTVAIVCAAAMAQAAAFDWKTAKSNGVNSPAEKVMVASTAYIFEATAAATVFESFSKGNDWTLGSLDNNTISADGKIATKDGSFTYGGSSAATINAIFAFTEKIGDKDYLYISTASGDVAGEEVGTKTISFKEAGVSSAINDLAGGYKGAGWYSAQSSGAPEPTSGLLMLLGMAGLALRRKQK